MAERAVSLDTNNAEYLTELGYELLLQGKSKDAMKCYQNAMKLDESSVQALTGKYWYRPRTKYEGKECFQPVCLSTVQIQYPVVHWDSPPPPPEGPAKDKAGRSLPQPQPSQPWRKGSFVICDIILSCRNLKVTGHTFCCNKCFFIHDISFVRVR